jgi:hypothetical protein
MRKKQKSRLRQEAKGRECQVRIPGVCNGNSETVVLAHLNNKRLFGAGTGQKVPDIFGAWACSACHDAVDCRVRLFDKDTCQAAILHYEGVFRTQNILLKEGKIRIGE